MDTESGRDAGREDGEITPPATTLPALLLSLVLLLLMPPPKSLSRWAMMPGIAMSSSGDRISCPPPPPPAPSLLPAFPPAFDRGFISFVKDLRLPAASPPPAALPAPVDNDEESEMSLIGDNLSTRPPLPPLPLPPPPPPIDVDPGGEGDVNDEVL